MATTLEVVLLYLIAAVAGVVVCRSLRLPPMLGYLAVGVLIGPNALALARDSAGVKYLAEFGVVFLMFVIGLEFNLPKLRSMRKLVFGLGLWQVALTMLGAVIGNTLLAAGFGLLGVVWGLDWPGALVLGSAVAMSSTAIVVKMMAEQTAPAMVAARWNRVSPSFTQNCPRATPSAANTSTHTWTIRTGTAPA